MSEIQLTNNQAINAIYGVYGQYPIFRKYNNGSPITRKPLVFNPNANPKKRDEYEVKQYGSFGLVNPGPKIETHFYNKLVDKVFDEGNFGEKAVSTTSQDFTKDPTILNAYNNNEGELFDKISDPVRFTIIVPNYSAAVLVISKLLETYGGSITIHDEKNDKKGDYEAFHFHGTYGSDHEDAKDDTTKHGSTEGRINFECQICMEDSYEVKKATDPYYHIYKQVPTPDGSRIQREKELQQKEITKYTRMIYNRTDFKENVDKVITINNDYLTRNPQPHPQSQKNKKLSHFMMINRLSEIYQDELAVGLSGLLTEINKIYEQSQKQQNDLGTEM